MSKAQTAMEYIESHEDGKILAQLEKQWAVAIRRVRETGNSASVTLALKVEVKSGSQLTITPKVTSKLPIDTIAKGVLWVGDEGNATTEDPKQPSLPAVALRN